MKRKHLLFMGILISMLLSACGKTGNEGPSVTPPAAEPTSEITGQAPDITATTTPTPTVTLTLTPSATSTPTPSPVLTPSEKPETIRWVNTVLKGPNKEEQAEINRLLQEKGINCEIVFYDYKGEFGKDYRTWVDTQVGGKLDIINSQAWSNNTDELEFIRDYMTDLTDYMETEEGQKLYQAYAPMDWDKLRIDGKIYSVQSMTTLSHRYWGVYLSVDDAYLDYFEGFDGTYRDLRRIYDEIGDNSLVLQMDSLETEIIYACLGLQSFRDLPYDDETDRFLSPADLGEDLNGLMDDLYRDIEDGVLKTPFGEETVSEHVLAEIYYGDRPKREGYTDILIQEDFGKKSYWFSYGIGKNSTKKDMAFVVLATCFSDPEISAILRKPIGEDSYWDEDYDWEERMERVADIDITSSPLYGFRFVPPDGKESFYSNEMDRINNTLRDNLFYRKSRTERPLNPNRNRDVAGSLSNTYLEELIVEMNRQLKEFRKKQN